MPIYRILRALALIFAAVRRAADTTAAQAHATAGAVNEKAKDAAIQAIVRAEQKAEAHVGRAFEAAEQARERAEFLADEHDAKVSANTNVLNRILAQGV